MQQRPVGSLVTALNTLGGHIGYRGHPGFPPLFVEGLLEGGKVTIPGDISSQFISSLMIAGPYAASDMEITVTGTVASKSYLDLTCDCMESFGITPEREGYRKFTIRSGERYVAKDYTIEGDYSSASYFFAIAAACGGKVQGDRLKSPVCPGRQGVSRCPRDDGMQGTLEPFWRGVGKHGGARRHLHRYVFVPRYGADALHACSESIFTIGDNRNFAS